MSKNAKIFNKTDTTPAQKKFVDAVALIMEAFSELEAQTYDACYEKAFEEGVEWLRGEFQRVSGSPTVTTESVIVPKAGLTEIEKITDQSIYSYISNNPGWRTSDLITKALELPVKPTLTEQNAKISINRLKREGKIDMKAGRWYTTEIRTGGQQYQVMAYLPDGSKYLGTDIIKEN